MSVKKDSSGRRSVQIEVEVPGSPEEVWQAIATGPGVTSWFVPTTVQESDGVPVSVTSNFGPGMDSIAKITSWDPPHRFSAEDNALGPNAPTVATEWIVEARSGGTCIVRVVHSVFADGDDWDNQLESWEGGWPDFFRILRIYLTHYRGQDGLQIQLTGGAPGSESDVWRTLTGSLGLADAVSGQRRKATGDAPSYSGVVELSTHGDKNNQILLRLDEPTGGIAHVAVLPMAGQVYVMVRFYFYGDRAAAVIARDEPRWQAWLKKHFPAIDPNAMPDCTTETHKVGDA